MAKFIKVTWVYNRYKDSWIEEQTPIFINADNIESIMPRDEGSSKSVKSVVTFTSTEQLRLAETPQEIINSTRN